MKIKLVMLALPAALILGGCSTPKDGPYGGHDASWYMKNSNVKEATAEYKWCMKQHDASKIESCKQVGIAAQKQLNNAMNNMAKMLGGDDNN